MIKQKHTQLGIALLLAGSMSGCASSFPFWSTSAQSPALGTPEARMVAAQEEIEVSKSPGGVNGAFSSAKQAVADAFTIEPRVTKTADPLSLTSKPDKIGADVFLTAGAFFESQGQMDRAREQYNRALENDPNQLLALVSLARLADRMGNSVKAKEIYQRALAAHPQSALAHNDLGLFHARKGRPEQAAQDMEQAVRLEPDNLRYGNNFATLLVELEQYDRALDQLSKTASPPEAHYNLGFLLYQNDQPQLARQHFAEAARMNPNLQQAHAMLARLEAQAHRQAQAYQAAEQYQAAPSSHQSPAAGSHQPQWSPTPGGTISPHTPPGSPAGEPSYTAGRPGMQQLPPVNQR